MTTNISKKISYGSVCSGVEAATMAWHHMGWEPSFFSDIEPFPCAVLQHHYPEVPLHGDFTTIGADDYEPIDLLVGGTPCQSFSVAGLRKGMADERGNLALEFLKLAQRTRPTWVVWENVPGVLSSNKGRDFGSFLAGLGEIGYGFAYRILNAQYFGVPQRRRRVFVVGYLGDWRPPASVLFERHSLQGHPAPSRKAGEEIAGTLATRFEPTDLGGIGTDEACSGYIQPFRMRGFGDYVDDDRASTVKERDNKDATDLVICLEPRSPDGVALPINTMTAQGRPSDNGRMGSGIGKDGDPCPTLSTAHSHAVAFAFGWQNSSSQGDSVSETVSPTLDKSKTPAIAIGIDEECNATVEGYGPLLRGGQGGTRQAVATAVVYDTTNITSKQNGSNPKPGDPCFTLAKGQHPPLLTEKTYCLQGAGKTSQSSHGSGHNKEISFTLNAIDKHAVCYSIMPQNSGKDYKAREVDVTQPIMAGGPTTGNQGGDIILGPVAIAENHGVASNMQVRRLTPVECERLQGFPDDFTKIPYRGKTVDKCPDGPRYKAMGNSMAVPVMRWIGERIQSVHNNTQKNKKG